jgi:hypothetical protein
MQRAEVMPLDGFGEMSEELEEFSGRLDGQLERDAHDGQVIRFHGGCPQGFFGFFAGTGFRIASGTLLRLFEAIAFSLEIQQFGFVHEPIDEGDDAAGIREDFGPFAERLVGRPKSRTSIVQTGNSKAVIHFGRVLTPRDYY